MEETRNREKISEPKEVIVIEGANTQFAHYAVIEPTQANLSADILQTIPYPKIRNRDILYLPLSEIQGNLNYW